MVEAFGVTMTAIGTAGFHAHRVGRIRRTEYHKIMMIISNKINYTLKHSSNTATALHTSTFVYIPDRQSGRTVVFLISTLF